LDAFLMGASDMGIRLVDTRHETVAVQAAEGYAKVSQKVGVCFVTANSGFSNALPGLATAFADRSPIFCVTSSAPQRDAEANVLQGFHDQVVLSKPVTKFAHRVACVEEIPRIVAHAFRTCSAGVPG
jgi:thiamine pyrophosphate-dependent acetolactate synthase large subunit-like protein